MKLAVIGHPIRHSKSPFMHNNWLKESGIEGHYEAIEVSPEQLKDQVERFKELGYKGFNVTIPHKETIIPFLDEIDPAAKLLGAVNTVVIEDGKCTGYNTDGRGFLMSLLTKRSESDIHHAQILVLGAGGAAKGIIGALKAFGAERISIANRTSAKAATLAEQQQVSGEGLDLKSAEKQLHRFDIVINTTSVGMVPDVLQMPVDTSLMKKGALAADIIYNPLSTQFLKTAESAGAESLNGIGMFVWQGALAFEKWTTEKPDTNYMIKKMTEYMKQE
ncbi:shikimate dehydrogenase [Jeotgalibacillus haloalkalitolerans]|uniref:Shikimate dehydrogenase (NADP(+)) n=1 Tax=Jeotgalibacillus haloalkalitolerans TaxID=3104292 RepID=A0ABU5KLZ9_9BACL|nr:shikimate dehydrogenase [Jeotgalibacillus sp. HH7-29]MDZ5712295.1 shikimate dehydrogenase [Jeotgalibacillus sp. HH7-29]